MTGAVLRANLCAMKGNIALIDMTSEITTNINVSGIPVEWIPEINKVSDNFSKAVRTLIKEALEARKEKESKPRKDSK